MLKYISHKLGKLSIKNTVVSTGWLTLRRNGFLWHLNADSHLSQEIIKHGVFEPKTTQHIETLLKPGMKVLDVGANIGYFSLIMARCVGQNGVVWAYEPTQYYRKQLQWHLDNNSIQNVHLMPYGLSNQSVETTIYLGNSSATMHWFSTETSHSQETISLKTFDQSIKENQIQDIEFIKIDVDGHELSFLEGAKDFFTKSKPIIMMEFSQANLDIAGSDVRNLRDYLMELGYHLFSDQTGKAYASKTEFLFECGNFTHSANVWLIPQTMASKDQFLTEILGAYHNL